MSSKNPMFEPSSARVSAALDPDAMIDYMYWLDYKVGPNSPNILIYAGQWDNSDGPTTIEYRLAAQTQNIRAQDLYAYDRQIYYIPSADGPQTRDYFRRTSNGKFTLMTVPKAGHYVPADVLNVTKSMLKDMILNQSLQCYTDDPKYLQCQTRHMTFAYIHYCSNHGECIYDKGWTCGDCREKVYRLTDYFNRKWVIKGA
jgi:hypothetical protein